MRLEHHKDDKQSIIRWFHNHPDKEVFNKFSKYKSIIKEEEFEILTKDYICETKEFIEFNRQNNEFYIRGIELLNFEIKDLNDDLKKFLSNLPLKSYYKKYDELLDVFYNTYLNRIERDRKINEILE